MSIVMKTVPLVVLCALIIAAPSVWANWVQDGVPLCTATGHQSSPAITSDGAGGAIVTWVGAGIYAQRVDASGVVKWTTDGVPLCTATGNKFYSAGTVIASDGAGGAIVTWWDSRNGNYLAEDDIYTQRVDASGVVKWTTDGVPVCTATGQQSNPTIISDGAGGAIVTWQDDRSGNYGIYAQRVNAAGTVQWAANGVVVCTATGVQQFPKIVSDGIGGAIVTWWDNRSGNWNLYAQRVNAAGSAQWGLNGVALCTATGNGDRWNFHTISDGAGGEIVTWYDDRSGNPDVYAQRVDASGVVKWTTDGIPLCTATGAQYYPAASSDDAGGAIVAWQDYRSGGKSNIYAQRVNDLGAVQWGTDGVAICTAIGFWYGQMAATITSDGAGGAIVAWQDDRSENRDIYAQRIDASGVVKWTTDGVPLCTATGVQYRPGIISDGAAGAIVTWVDARNGDPYVDGDIYAQRVDGAGHTVVATLLHDYATTFLETGIMLKWTLSDLDMDVDFFVLRSSALNGSFVELPLGAFSRDGLSFSFVDRNWEPGTSYYYRVEYNCFGERRTLFETGPIVTPAMPMTLCQNSPNPFNPSTTIRYYIPKKSRVILEVYDIVGRRVAILVAAEQGKGNHAAVWGGRNDKGNSVASGVYFCRLKAGKETLTKKMVMLK